MIVYLVKTHVDFGTWEVDGLFSTRIEADRYVEEVRKIDSYDMEIEEMKVDAFCGHHARDVFACSVNVSGEVRRRWFYQLVTGDDHPDEMDHFGELYIGRSIKSAERAEELAREALRAWVDGGVVEKG